MASKPFTTPSGRNIKIPGQAPIYLRDIFFSKGFYQTQRKMGKQSLHLTLPQSILLSIHLDIQGVGSCMHIKQIAIGFTPRIATLQTDVTVSLTGES